MADGLPLQDVYILIVDDELDTQELTTFVLQQAGATVLTASSAADALRMLSQSKVDVIVSDIGMPEMDGYMMMRQIRTLPEVQAGIPAIALTAYAGEFNRQKALAAGFQRHLAKPVEPDALIAAVTTLVKEFGSL
jgi:CheY-like chemotaxis protein